MLGGETRNPIGERQSHDILKYLISRHEKSARISAYRSSVDEPTPKRYGSL